MVAPDRLATFPLFHALPKRAIEALAQVACPLSFRSGQRMVSLNDPARRISLVFDGVAGLTGVTVDGAERITYLYRRGDVIGSRFLAEAHEATCEVVALTGVEGVGVEIEDVERIGDAHPELLLAVTRSFADRMYRLCDRLLLATTLEVPVRLSAALLDLHDARGGDGDGWHSLVARFPHRILAEIVGASRPHVSAVLGDLEEAGGIRRNGRHELRVRPARLERIVRDGELGAA